MVGMLQYSDPITTIANSADYEKNFIANHRRVRPVGVPGRSALWSFNTLGPVMIL